jgi:hypothetical protein
MIVRTLKLQPNAGQEAKMCSWLWNLTGVYNFAIKKIENDAKDSVYHSESARLSAQAEVQRVEYYTRTHFYYGTVTRLTRTQVTVEVIFPRGKDRRRFSLRTGNEVGYYWGLIKKITNPIDKD